MATLADCKAALLKKTERRYKTIDVDGLKFRLQSLTEGERMQVEAVVGTALVKPTAICLCCVDEEGNRLFDLEESKQLLEVDTRYTVALWVEIASHIGFDSDDIKTVEESEKN